MKTLISNFWLLGITLMTVATMNFSSCKDDENGVDTPDNPTGQIDSLVTYYDDLEYFQNYFVRTDALGNLRYRSMGVPLYESDSAHLYIGVDNLDEALRYFNYAIAPDIEQKVSVSHNYTYTFTDTLGNIQGTVSFVPGSGTSVAEITTDLADLKHFNTVTFLQNSAWPHNSGEGNTWKLGDTRIFTINNPASELLEASDKYPEWVLVREKGNGKMPVWATITNHTYNWRPEIMYSIYDYDYGPDRALATEIYQTLHNNWDLLSSKLPHTTDLWIGSIKTIGGTMNPFRTSYYGYININGEINYIEWINYKHCLLHIDWIDDAPGGFYTLTGTSDKDFSNESAVTLFDNDPQTKWCSDEDSKVESEISGKDCWMVEFMTEKPIKPTAYNMVTGNDQSVFPGRSPRIWSIYARNNPADVWTLIDRRDNTNSYPERMTDADCWTGGWNLTGITQKYQYFRLEMYENWGDDCFQISEFKLVYDENAPDVNGDELYYSLIDASDGEPQNLAGNLFDNNFDTKWCVDEDNKSGTPLADDKCWFVEFKASKPITPTGYHMVTANDHTMFPDRAPRKWSLFGLKDGWWVRLATVDNTNTDVLQMTYADKWTGNWTITEHKGEYQIFRLEMYENWGGDCFQISELGFNF